MIYPDLYSREEGYGTGGDFIPGLGESTGLNNGVINEEKITSYGTVQGYKDGKKEGTDPYVTDTHYEYVVGDYYSVSEYNLVSINQDYWLASREVAVYGWANFGLRCIRASNSVYFNGFLNGEGRESEYIYPVRPIVSLENGFHLIFDKIYDNGTVSYTYWDIEF